MKIKASYGVLLLVISAALGFSGCADYYTGYPDYGPYYGGPYNGGPYYRGGPYYTGYPGSVTIAVGDRPYYVRGPGYYAGHSYYVWRPGHWGTRHGQKVWIHGKYVVRA